MEITTVEAVRSMTNKEMVIAILELQAQVQSLIAKTQPAAKVEGKEMTDDDARRVIVGDLSATKHKEAATQLGLSYGQIYSARLEFTFKHIHKEIKESGKTNPWVK